MAIVDRIETARDATFAARVSMALMSLCVDIANEVDSTPNHANRLALAQAHFRAGVNAKTLAAAMIANNSGLQTAIDAAPAALGTNISDADLQSVISGLIDHFANAYAAA